MLDNIRPAVISAASKVFETMFFIPLEVQDENGGEEAALLPSSGVFRGEIEFQGKLSGRLRLYLPSQLADMMACNFMGVDEENASESQTADMVNELCNMICGNLFSQLDRKVVWDLAIPHTQLVPDQGAKREADPPSAISVDFLAEGFEVKLVLQFDA